MAEGQLTRDEILDTVRDRLADILETDPSGIAEGNSFVDDLEADSLALIELVEALEEAAFRDTKNTSVAKIKAALREAVEPLLVQWKIYYDFLT